jgi:hypothetical protein
MQNLAFFARFRKCRSFYSFAMSHLEMMTQRHFHSYGSEGQFDQRIPDTVTRAYSSGMIEDEESFPGWNYFEHLARQREP